jgi:hypothetical protein
MKPYLEYVVSTMCPFLGGGIVVLVTVEPSEGKEEQMNYYPDFDPYFVRERNEGLLREVSTFRLEKLLREGRSEPSASQLVAFASKCTLPLLRRVGLAGGR